MTTFQSNNTVVSKLVWLELNINLNDANFQKSFLDCQCSTAVRSNVTGINQFLRMTMPQM